MVTKRQEEVDQVQHNLRPVTVHRLEAELSDYETTRRAIEALEEALAAPDPTFTRATVVAEYRLLTEMQRTVQAIDQILGRPASVATAAVKGELPDDMVRWVRLRYQALPSLSAEEAATKAGVSWRQAQRWKWQVLTRLADLLGAW
jgi:hypothetical protein